MIEPAQICENLCNRVIYCCKETKKGQVPIRGKKHYLVISTDTYFKIILLKKKLLKIMLDRSSLFKSDPNFRLLFKDIARLCATETTLC